MENNIVLRNVTNLDKYVNSTLSFIEKDYIYNNQYEIVPVPKEIEEIDFNSSIRLLKLGKFVYERDENIIEKLSSVYSALHGGKSSVFLLIKSNGVECEFFIGVRNKNNATQSVNILKSSLEGNFPGTKLEEDFSTNEIQSIMNDILEEKSTVELTSVLGIPSLKTEKNQNFLQGVENLINGMQGKEFTTLIIADPIDNKQLSISKSIYEKVYTELSIFKDTNFNLSKNEATTLTETIGESLGKTYTESNSNSESHSVSGGVTKGTGKSKNLGGVGTGAGTLVGMAIGTFIAPGIGTYLGGQLGGAVGSGLGSLVSSTNENHSTSSTQSDSKTNSSSESYGETKTVNKSSSTGNTSGESKGIQYTQNNKKVHNILKKLDNQLERLEMGESRGLWNVGAYFLSPNVQVSAVAANIYSGLLRGDKSGIEKTAIRTFYRGEDLDKIKDYMFNFSNPYISYNDGIVETINTLGSLVSTDELTLQINIPKKSITGLKVVEMASFGRNINQNEGIRIGKLYHLGKNEEINMNLDINSLSSHTFITGSTGSGKSNTVYKIVEKLIENQIKILVIEPAKGEYKNIFGGRKDVNIFGTNIEYTPLLKINPFKFNDKTHILEHIDKFIEILNAVWPMYAAMPAVLKEAIEEIYIEKGWDLEFSINTKEYPEYPEFKDLVEVLPRIIERSGYSEEVKSNYKGALVTRVKSLTNGIIGKIFTSDELESKKLFGENTIIDLSRVGSIETKSLLMGIIFLKLQQYRLSNATSANEKLKHVTIIEEAHNLLKKTTTEQSSEGSNVQGKSVEMISNSIAEMRTYGEGFIIVDQSPSLLDESAIKNTNTKIVLRLPSLQDRELVGKSMNLNENQINELAKLETGVAAIYQNNWEEAVLSKIDICNEQSPYEYSYDKYESYQNMVKAKSLLLKHLLRDRIEKAEILGNGDKGIMVNYVYNDYNLTSYEKSILLENLERDTEISFGKKAGVINKLVNGNQIMKKVYDKIGYYNPEGFNDYQLWHNEILKALNEINKGIDCEYKTHIVDSLLRNEAELSNTASHLYINWTKEIREGKIAL